MARAPTPCAPVDRPPKLPRSPPCTQVATWWVWATPSTWVQQQQQQQQLCTDASVTSWGAGGALSPHVASVPAMAGGGKTAAVGSRRDAPTLFSHRRRASRTSQAAPASRNNQFRACHTSLDMALRFASPPLAAPQRLAAAVSTPSVAAAPAQLVPLLPLAPPPALPARRQQQRRTRSATPTFLNNILSTGAWTLPMDHPLEAEALGVSDADNALAVSFELVGGGRAAEPRTRALCAHTCTYTPAYPPCTRTSARAWC